MCGKDINYKSGNSGLITHIKARHEYERLNFVANKKGGLKRTEANGDIRDLFNHYKAPKLLINSDKKKHVKHQQHGGWPWTFYL